MNGALALSLIIFFSFTIPVAVSIALASIFGIAFFSNLPLLLGFSQVSDIISDFSSFLAKSCNYLDVIQRLFSISATFSISSC